MGLMGALVLAAPFLIMGVVAIGCALCRGGYHPEDDDPWSMY